MGTRSRIAIANSDGTFTSIYCHWDGYPSHNGQILMDHYTDESKVRALIALGDLSSLRNTVGLQHKFDDNKGRANGWCTFYGRDRGERNTQCATHPDLLDLCNETQGCGGEWLYLFKDGQWLCAKGGWSAFGMPADKAPAEDTMRPVSDWISEEA